MRPLPVGALVREAHDASAAESAEKASYCSAPISLRCTRVTSCTALSCGAVLAIVAIVVAIALPTLAWAQVRDDSSVIALVMGTWRSALYETPGAKEECPEGFQHKHAENYKAQFSTPEARQAQEQRFGYYTNRGPNGENTFYFPTLIEDPLPFRAVQGSKAIGLNLDGEDEGVGTLTSAPHPNFTSPDGERGIDNQLYRVIGCVPGWRKGGMIDGIVRQYLRSEVQARVLIEITDVQDEQNDAQVTVTTYRGLDPVAEDTSGTLVPWLSQRIDYKRGLRYVHRTQGRIVEGVLTTDPIDAILPSYEQPDMAGDRDIRQMRWRLRLTPNGAEGLLGGYVDLEQWYLMYAKTWGAHTIADVQGWSGPATYQALKRFADFRDPHNGELTAISAAYEVAFARTFILHTPKGDAQVAATFEQRARPEQLSSTRAQR
jgi:type II secretory pathway pseudopilin PulG